MSKLGNIKVKEIINKHKDKAMAEIEEYIKNECEHLYDVHDIYMMHTFYESKTTIIVVPCYEFFENAFESSYRPKFEDAEEIPKGYFNQQIEIRKKRIEKMSGLQPMDFDDIEDGRMVELLAKEEAKVIDAAFLNLALLDFAKYAMDYGIDGVDDYE